VEGGGGTAPDGAGATAGVTSFGYGGGGGSGGGAGENGTTTGGQNNGRGGAYGGGGGGCVGTSSGRGASDGTQGCVKVSWS